MSREPADLDRKILAVLAHGPLSTASLARAVREKPEVVAQHCRALKRGHQVVDLGGHDLAILAMLRRKGHLPTPALTRQGPGAGPGTHRIYQRCLRMEDQAHVLTSQKVKSQKVLFYFPGTGDVLGRNNFSEIQQAVDALREIARRHKVPPRTQIPETVKEELRREYRTYLHHLAAAAEPLERPKITSFERDLMRVLKGTTVSDVVTCVSLRGFHPKVRDWQITLEMEQAIERALRWLRARYSRHSSRPWEDYGWIPGTDEIFWVLRMDHQEKAKEEINTSVAAGSVQR
jgi:hypothetical protein